MGNGFSFFTGNSAATVDDTPDKAAVPSPTIESKQEQDTNPAAAKSPKQASHGAREKRVVSAAKADAKHKQTTAAKRGKKTDLDIKWDNQFKELQKFQKKTGHCLVPFHYDANPSLGLWVSNQRCRKDKLSEDRLDRLDAIGFEWSVRQTSSSPSPPRSKQTTPKAKMTIPKAKSTATSKKEEKEVAAAASSFGTKLFLEVSKNFPEGNILVSPLSVYKALAMVSLDMLHEVTLVVCKISFF